MKKLTIALLMLLMTMPIFAQFKAGIEDSRYVYGSYSPVEGLDVGLQHSLYSEKMGFQRIGAFVGYGQPFGEGFKWHVGAFGGTTWNGNYQVINGHASLSYNYRILTLIGKFQPMYDSELKYKSTYLGRAIVSINDHIGITAAYTNIPEFRVPEKRLRGGFDFKVSKLRVTPELSFSLERYTRFKNMRVLMSMSYEF